MELPLAIMKKGTIICGYKMDLWFVILEGTIDLSCQREHTICLANIKISFCYAV